jgi:hypothetical protein
MTLGRYPRVTLARARTMALDALARVHVGEDPRRTAAANVADLAAAYLAEYVRPNLRTCRDVERRFKKDVLPAIGTVPLADLHKRDINRVISPIVQRGRQEQAGRVFKDLRAMLRWGVERGDLDTNPANGVRKPASRPPRERVLSDGEIAQQRDVGLGPAHDWSSHAADAFGLMAIAYEEPQVSAEPKGRPKYRPRGRDYWLAN